ncbi:hypothetical protein BCR43DRAFT_481499 [Syncephalastrum racemosum]|uniref:Ricin B lectin domain-containing protein n=1 Tax=Syncephalastrum racemosum TaxID=13706 RepID=A0A1X2HS52_SYNRA|nr:hypothetical protein BCR43DRAFT_481499 [Syncephalastrum racemosum]
MMPSPSFLVIFFTALVAMVAAQGVSDTGKKDGNDFYKHAKSLSEGNYVFKGANTKKALTFVSSDNILSLLNSGSQTWEIRKHENTKYFSAHGKNNADLEKCISTRWTVGNGDGGYPDAAVLWQCEIDGSKPKSTGGYEKIFPPKQLWAAVPDPKYDGYVKIVSASHLYDMVPRCISQDKIDGGTKLAECKYDTDDKSLLWKIVKASKDD